MHFLGTGLRTETVTLYYEIAPVFVERGYPPYVFQVADPNNLVVKHSRALSIANRVWRLKPDGTVSYSKNRETGTMTPVDMKEFFLVQLRSMPYNKLND
jgi:hypothetical protein